jgi:hypothetical protein
MQIPVLPRFKDSRKCKLCAQFSMLCHYAMYETELGRRSVVKRARELVAISMLINASFGPMSACIMCSVCLAAL